MNMKKAKEYMGLGILNKFHALRDPLAAGSWLMIIEDAKGNSWTLETALGEAKSFSSLDTLVRQGEEIFGVQVAGFELIDLYSREMPIGM